MPLQIKLHLFQIPSIKSGSKIVFTSNLTMAFLQLQPAHN